jgi:transposase-like protein
MDNRIEGCLGQFAKVQPISVGSACCTRQNAATVPGVPGITKPFGLNVEIVIFVEGLQKFAPLYQEAAKAHRHRVGPRWSAYETYGKVAGLWGYVYRAIDEYGQVVEVLFREHRGTEAVTAFFRSALENTGVAPHTVTSDKAAAYPPALAAVLPEVEHLTGKAEQQRIERDHQHLKGRLKTFRGCKTTRGRSDSAKPTALSATCAKASSGSGRYQGIRTTPSGRGWREPGRNSRLSC